MKKVSLAQVSAMLAKDAPTLGDEVLIVTKGKRALAALVPLNDVDEEAFALSTNPEFLAMIQKARADGNAGHELTFDELKARTLRRKEPSRRALPQVRTKRARVVR